MKYRPAFPLLAALALLVAGPCAFAQTGEIEELKSMVRAMQKTIDNTLYGSATLMWQPTTSFRMGLEYLYGREETIDGSERDAHRFNVVFRYDLVR